jgi:hypothetical protein
MNELSLNSASFETDGKNTTFFAFGQYMLGASILLKLFNTVFALWALLIYLSHSLNYGAVHRFSAEVPPGEF